MRSDSELVAAAHLSYIGSFRKLVEHSSNGEVRSPSPVFAFVSGLPTPLFNGCVVTEPTTEAELDAALVWLNRRRVPYQVSIAEPLASELSDVVAGHGLQLDPAPYPGMVLHPVPEPPEPAPGVTVVAGTAPGLADYLPRSFVADPDVRVFTARLDGRPVGSSTAVRTGEVAGVYGVGTLPEARRRGIGTAASWAAVEAGRAWGCDPIVLQANEMGLPIYERMGFRTVVRYITFRSSEPGPAHEPNARSRFNDGGPAERWARTVRTKGGKTLSAADIERLASKAERGFDLSRWRPHRGRPSLSATAAGRSPRIGARVPDDLYRRATERAAAEGRSISEVVRDHLAAYAGPRAGRPSKSSLELTA